jgi:AraC-like DNA-binding protein
MIVNSLTIYIKNMGSIRSREVVKTELAKLGIGYTTVDLGELEILVKISKKQLYILSDALKIYGLELLYDDKKILAEKIQNIIISLFNSGDHKIIPNYSRYLSVKLNHDYKYLSNIFSEIKGTTIEQLYLTYMMEKAKELLVYTELTLSEIARKLNYGSVSQLSKQFRKITGLSPSHFKNLKLKKQTSTEHL